MVGVTHVAISLTRLSIYRRLVGVGWDGMEGANIVGIVKGTSFCGGISYVPAIQLYATLPDSQNRIEIRYPSA